MKNNIKKICVLAIFLEYIGNEIPDIFIGTYIITEEMQ